jgi:hypothetical protein
MKRFILAIWCLAGIGNLWAGERVIPHVDREIPKVIFKDEATNFRAKTARLAADQYVEREWERFQLAPQGRNLVLERTKKSLLGTHFHYRQMLNGLPVEKGTFVVTLDKSHRVTRIYNNTFPVTEAVPQPPAGLISGDDALQISWFEVGVKGDLMRAPQAELCYRYHNNKFELIYRTWVPVTEPLGDWRMALDPKSGRVLEFDNMLVMHRHGQTVKPTDRSDERFTPRDSSQLRDFYEAMDTLQTRDQILAAKKMQNKRRVDGTGTVFDPDPRTTLLDFTFEDFVDESVVAPAYKQVTLRDITENDEGIFELIGPNVTISTIDASFFGPNTPVVTSPDGTWNYTRGEKGFNNAMVYYQLDKNQRYMQSLGFTGDMEIQSAGVLADTDAVNGGDQSFFSEPNFLAFGEGGVDDAEDADVILHEYGHAIQHYIVPTWDVRGDADEGGIGEGFGDYWAASYSLSTENGYLGNRDWIFSWDGHNNNWPGRRMDRLDLVYSRSEDYDDHQIVTCDGCLTFGESDELWSAPLFQSLVDLFKRGLPREEMDRIVLQSHFGLGDSIDMHDLSAITIDTARALYPDGPHATTLHNFFAMVNIEQPVSSYTYVAPHIPPCQGDDSGNCVQQDGFWYSAIEVSNPNASSAIATFETYGVNGEGNYGLLDSQMVSINAGATVSFVPPQTTQRWVRITSDQPLGGSQFFERTGLQEGEGTESAAIPLLTEVEVANELILPHVPENREGFWSGAVIVNTTDTTQTVNLIPVGTAGNDLSAEFPQDALRRVLAPFEKIVSFITPIEGFSGALVDDSALSEKVSYLRLEATGEIAAFELFGYNAANAELATTGIVAQPNQDRTAYSIRTALADVDWNGFTMLNPDDETRSYTLTVYNEAGNAVQSVSTTIAPRTKLLGLNTNFGGFSFPSNGTPLITIEDPAQAASVVIEGLSNFRIFDLSGDLANTTIDGGAVAGFTTKTVFTNPTGSLRLLQAIHDETVFVETYTRNGNALTKETETYNLSAGETRVIDIQGTPESIAVRGAFVNPSVITREANRNVLRVRNGHQIEISVDDEP